MRHHHIRRSLALALCKALKAHTASRRALVAQRLHTILHPAAPWRVLSSSRVPLAATSTCHRHPLGRRRVWRAVLGNLATFTPCGYWPRFGGSGTSSRALNGGAK